MRQCHLITNFNEVMSEKALIKCLLLNCCWGLWWFYHNTVLSLISVKIKFRGTLWNCNYSWSFAVSQRLSRGCINSCLSKTIMVQFVFFFNRFRLWHSNNHLFMILEKNPQNNRRHAGRVSVFTTWKWCRKGGCQQAGATFMQLYMGQYFLVHLHVKLRRFDPACFCDVLISSPSEWVCH